MIPIIMAIAQQLMGKKQQQQNKMKQAAQPQDQGMGQQQPEMVMPQAPQFQNQQFGSGTSTSEGGMTETDEAMQRVIARMRGGQ